MLSYQHKYHVGNHADVLKHLCWISVIRYLNTKEKPYTLIDTHAGEGLYTQSKNIEHESENGVVRLLELIQDDWPDNLISYRQSLLFYQQQQQLPGSPALAANLMRMQDEMHCFELHPQAEQALRQFSRSSTANIFCHRRDAFEGVTGITPPKIKRGAILIDPPYEQIQEYQSVRAAIEQVQGKWSSSQILLWVPLLGQRAKEKAHAAQQLIAHYKDKQALGNDISIVELSLAEQYRDEGMYGSVMIVMNPYWQFRHHMQQALPLTAAALGSHWDCSIS